MASPPLLSSASPSAEYCMDLGFQSNSLLCTSCDKLSDFDLEDELGEQCRSCCKSKDESKNEDALVRSKRYIPDVVLSKVQPGFV